MAATFGTRRQNNIIGFRRTVTWDAVTWNNNDTITVPGMKRIEMVDFIPTTNASFGVTIAANVLTLVSGGSLTGLMQITGI